MTTARAKPPRPPSQPDMFGMITGRSSNFAVWRGSFPSPKQRLFLCGGQRRSEYNLTFVQKFHVDVFSSNSKSNPRPTKVGRMAKVPINDPKHWRERPEDARTVADELND
jgi:hypothetical protein